MSKQQQDKATARPCECHILLRNGEIVDSRHGDRPISDISRIELCAMHRTAAEVHEGLCEALETALHECQVALHCAQGDSCNPADHAPGLAAAVRAARAALAKMDGDR